MQLVHSHVCRPHRFAFAVAQLAASLSSHPLGVATETDLSKAHVQACSAENFNPVRFIVDADVKYLSKEEGRRGSPSNKTAYVDNPRQGMVVVRNVGCPVGAMPSGSPVLFRPDKEWLARLRLDIDEAFHLAHS